MKQSKITTFGVWQVHLAGAMLCAGLIAAGWLLGLGPLLSESQQSTTIAEQADVAQDRAQRSKARLETLAGQLDAVHEQLQDRPVSLEPASAINPLLAELARWSDEQQLTVTGTTAGRPIALAYYDYVPITLSGEGAYRDLMGFFQKLYADRGDLGVIAFHATRLPATGGVSYEIQLAWYVVRDADDATDASVSVSVE